MNFLKFALILSVYFFKSISFAGFIFLGTKTYKRAKVLYEKLKQELADKKAALEA